MAMPSGWRSSAPSPCRWRVAWRRRGRQGGHQDRPEAQQAGVADGVAGVSACLRCARATSIIMMAFFLTMPMSRITPIIAIRLNSVRRASSASSAPTPAEGSVDRMVMDGSGSRRDAQHDVDGDQRGEDQQRLVAHRLWKAPAEPEAGAMPTGTPMPASAASIADERWPRRWAPLGQVEADGGRRRKPPWWLTDRRRQGGSKRASADRAPAPPAG